MNYFKKKESISFSSIVTTLVIASIFALFVQAITNNYIFFNEREKIFAENDMVLNQKMIKRNERLFLDGHINESEYLTNEKNFYTNIKDKSKEIVEVCQRAESKNQKTKLKNLQTNIKTGDFLNSIKYLLLSIVSGIEQIKDFFSGWDENNEKYKIKVDEKIDSQLKKIPNELKNSTLSAYTSSLFFSACRFFGINVKMLIDIK